MIQAGKLDRRMTILAAGPSEGPGGVTVDAMGQVVPDALGQPVATYVDMATTWAQRLDLRTQDAARAGGRDTYDVVRWRIRWRQDVTTSMRVRVDGQLYDIKAIDEPVRRESLVLTCEEVDE